MFELVLGVGSERVDDIIVEIVEVGAYGVEVVTKQVCELRGDVEDLDGDR